jgi:hypothetical protein
MPRRTRTITFGMIHTSCYITHYPHYQILAPPACTVRAAAVTEHLRSFSRTNVQSADSLQSIMLFHAPYFSVISFTPVREVRFSFPLILHHPPLLSVTPQHAARTMHVMTPHVTAHVSAARGAAIFPWSSSKQFVS